MQKVRIGSLFSGIGGLELGVERGFADEGLSAETLFQVEIEPFCRSVLAKRWPTAVQFEDVRGVGKHNLPSVDVLCFGFPCTDVSWAGTGRGLAGERSGLNQANPGISLTDYVVRGLRMNPSENVAGRSTRDTSSG